MALTEAVIEGTLKEDGTLELDGKPNLSPGRVLVVVQPLSKPAAAKRGLVEVMDEIRDSQRARRYQGRTLETTEAEEKARQEEDEEYDRAPRSYGATHLFPQPYDRGTTSSFMLKNQPFCRDPAQCGMLDRVALCPVPEGFAR